jgi:thiamine biosynthesis lipoprotein
MTAESPRRFDRRDFLALGLGAFVVASLPFAARRGARIRRPGLARRTIPVMGTIAELAVLDPDPRGAQAALDAAVDELRRVEAAFTRFHDTSDIGRANLGAAREAVAVSPATAYVVAEALRWAAGTAGAYDPAIGGAVSLWDVTNRHEPPPARQVSRFAGRQLFHTVEVGRSRRGPVLRYHDADARLDLGGIAKGYGVDRAVEVLRRHGITQALVDVGGDLYALGTAPGGDPWEIGIRDPDDADALIGTLRVSDAAVATSGTYLQYFRYHGRRYHHLIDPVTGAPRLTPEESLTIRADRCMEADVAATALFGMSRDEAGALLRRLASGAEVARIA